MLRVKLVRSPIGRSPKITNVLRALGLKRPGQSVELKDVPAARGAVKKVINFVEIEGVHE